ncbi:6230_t:CDS:2, partial [Cetraspora pellucida]
EASRKIQNAKIDKEEFQKFKLLAEFYQKIVNEVRKKKPYWLKEKIKIKQETHTLGRQCRPNTPERKKQTRHLAKGRAQTSNNTRTKSDDSPEQHGLWQCYNLRMDIAENKKGAFQHAQCNDDEHYKNRIEVKKAECNEVKKNKHIGVENDKPIEVEEDE